MIRSDSFFAFAAAANPTWPTGRGGAVTGAPTPASALTRVGIRVVLKNVFMASGVTGGFAGIKQGDGVTNYFGGLAFNVSINNQLRDANIELWNGLSVDTSGLVGGGVIIEYEYIGTA